MKLIGHAAEAYGAATVEFEATIRYAVAEHGVSLREAAEQAGVSHMTVKRIVDRTTGP